MTKIKKNVFCDKIFSKILAVICTILWGTTAPTIKIMFENLNIQDSDVSKQIYFAGICFALSGLFTLLIPCIKRKKILLINKNTVIDTLLLAVIQTTLQYVFFYIGLSHTTGTKASILSSLCTFFIIVLSHFIYKNEKLNLQKTFGCILGFISMVILNLDSTAEYTSLEFSLLGEGFVLFAAISIAISTPICKKLSITEDSLIFTGNSFLIGGIILVVIGLIYHGEFNLISNYSNLWLLAYFVISTSLAGVIWNYLLQYNEVSKISIYNLLVPIFGTIFSCIFLGENIYDPKTIISLIFASTGIYFVEKVFKRVQYKKEKIECYT